MSLGFWGRLIVLGIGCSVIFITAIIVTCFAHPHCLGFKCLTRLSDKKRKKASSEIIKIEDGIIKKNAAAAAAAAGAGAGAGKFGEDNWISENNYIIYQTGNPGMQVKKSDEILFYQSNERETNLKFAPFSVNPLVAEDREQLSLPSLKVKLSFSHLTADSMMCRLNVLIMEANSLPYREYFSSMEPFITLDLLNSKWSLQRSEKIVKTVHTRVVRHTFNPKFDQSFFFDVKRSEIKDLCLKFTLFDEDRLTRRTPICRKRIYLRDVKNLLTEPEVMLVTDLREIDRNQGELLFGVSYLPTAQRLSLSILKASCLKFLTVVKSVNEFCPYVRVLMLNGRGKCVKRKKTSYRIGEENPVFNETLAFDLPISNLEHSVFLLVLCSKILGKRSSSDGSITDAETEHPPKDGKDNVLGAIVIGRNVKCSKARDHWLMVMQNPRRVISVWHRLR